MAGETLYTGRGLAAKMPDTSNAMKGLTDFIQKAEETKFNVFQKNKDAFMKMTDVDPVMFLTTANQQAQAKLLDEFNKEASQIYKNSGGFPSMEDMQQIQAKKNYLISAQNDMQADMERYLQDREAVSKDFSGQINQDVFKEREEAYFSGERKYGTDPLTPSSINPYAHYSNNRNKGTGTEGDVTLTVKKDGKLVTEVRRASATESEAREMFLADMMSSPRLTMGVIEQFQRLRETDPDEYRRRLDTDDSGDVDAGEEKEAGYMSNPIIEWAQDTFWKNKIKIEEKTAEKPVTEKKVKEGTDARVGGETIRILSGVKRPSTIKYGGVNRQNLYSFSGGEVINNIATDGGTDLSKPSPIALGSGTNISGQLVDYDADANALIIRTTTGIPTLNLDSKSLVQIPLDNVIGGENLPITVDGKETTIGAMAGQTTKKVNIGI